MSQESTNLRTRRGSSVPGYGQDWGGSLRTSTGDDAVVRDGDISDGVPAATSTRAVVIEDPADPADLVDPLDPVESWRRRGSIIEAEFTDEPQQVVTNPPAGVGSGPQQGENRAQSVPGPGVEPTATGPHPISVTVCRSVSFRAGHVIDRPHVHDFALTVALGVTMDSATGQPSTDTVDLARVTDAFLATISAQLGQVMLWWPQDTGALRKPVSWPDGIAGPKMPLKRWHTRPDRVALVSWIAGQLAQYLAAYAAAGVQVSAVELATTGLGAAVTRVPLG